MKEEFNTIDFNPTEEFFEHCNTLNSCVYKHIDGYDYIDITSYADETIVTISNCPIHGNGTYETSDKNAKDISIAEALNNIKLKYKDKNIKIIDLRK